ncbi:MAG TPA: dihydropteroate synthase [Fimbriimonas sp.]
MFALPHNRPAVMGILNVTPDSFSDGGKHYGLHVAIDAARRMIDEGADLIDVGGESTRPGAEPVEAEEEVRRVLPVVEALAASHIAVSVDTTKPEVARLALGAGAQIINDVSGLRDPRMRSICLNHRCVVCLMHMLGEPRTMQASPRYPRGVVAEVRESLFEAAERVRMDGIDRDHIWVDPGIGFGKTTDHNLSLLRSLGEIVSLGYPVLVGVSRKAFIGRLLRTHEDPLPPDQRLEGTLAVQVLAQSWGAKIIRAHDVQAARRAVDVTAAILGM